MKGTQSKAVSESTDINKPLDCLVRDYLFLKKRLMGFHKFFDRPSTANVLELTVKIYLNKMEMLLIQIFMQAGVYSLPEGGLNWLRSTDCPDSKGFVFLLNEAYSIFKLKESLNLFEKYDLSDDYISVNLLKVFPKLERIFLVENMLEYSGSSEGSMSRALCMHSMFSSHPKKSLKMMEDTLTKKQELFNKVFAVGLFNKFAYFFKWELVEKALSEYIEIFNDKSKFCFVVKEVYRSYEYRFERERTYTSILRKELTALLDKIFKRDLSSLKTAFSRLDSIDVLREEQLSLPILIKLIVSEGDDEELVKILRKDLCEVEGKIRVLNSNVKEEESKVVSFTHSMDGGNDFSEAVDYTHNSLSSLGNCFSRLNSLDVLEDQRLSLLTLIEQAFLDGDEDLMSLFKKDLHDVEVKISGAMRSQVGNSIGNADTHWYSDDEIVKLFGYYISKYPGVAYLDPMLGTNWGNGHNTLQDNLHAYHIERDRSREGGTPIKNKIIIPVNLAHGHWVLIYIIYPENIDGLSQIYYFDPKGEEPPHDLRKVILSESVFPGCEMINVGQYLQDDEYNCGAWVVEAARAIAYTGAIPGKNHDIHRARNEHNKIARILLNQHESSQNQISLLSKAADKGKEENLQKSTKAFGSMK